MAIESIIIVAPESSSAMILCSELLPGREDDSLWIAQQ